MSPILWARCFLSLGCAGAVACASVVDNNEPPFVFMLATRYVLTPAESSVASFAVRTSNETQFGDGSGRSPLYHEAGQLRSSNTAAVTVGVAPALLKAAAVGSSIITVVLSLGTDTGTVVVVADTSLVRARAVRVEVGAQHACLESIDGVVSCWGRSVRGKLGDGSVRSFTSTLSPVRVSFGGTLRRLTVGFEHACAIAADRSAVCWGDNSNRQVQSSSGDAPFSAPVRVASPQLLDAVSAGGDHTCGITLLAEVVCWGRRYAGIEKVSTPDQVVVALSSGYAHTCRLIRTAAHRAWA